MIREDIIGKVFGKLKVLELDSTKKTRTFYICKCDCGNKKSVRKDHLIKKETTSCGCHQKKRTSEASVIDLTGMMFGELKVLYREGNNSFRNCKWKCVCSCGREILVLSGNLRRGISTSCGHNTESKIASGLKIYFSENYDAKIEYKIFKNPETKNWLPYDIYLPRQNIFIEIHGKQHYTLSSKFHRDQQDFEDSKYRDKIKKKFAGENGVYIEVDLRKIKTLENAIAYIENKL